MVSRLYREDSRNTRVVTLIPPVLSLQMPQNALKMMVKFDFLHSRQCGIKVKLVQTIPHYVRSPRLEHMQSSFGCTLDQTGDWRLSCPGRSVFGQRISISVSQNGTESSLTLCNLQVHCHSAPSNCSVSSKFSFPSPSHPPYSCWDFLWMARQQFS